MWPTALSKLFSISLLDKWNSSQSSFLLSFKIQVKTPIIAQMTWFSTKLRTCTVISRLCYSAVLATSMMTIGTMNKTNDATPVSFEGIPKEWEITSSQIRLHCIDGKPVELGRYFENLLSYLHSEALFKIWQLLIWGRLEPCTSSKYFEVHVHSWHIPALHCFQNWDSTSGMTSTLNSNLRLS